MISRILGSALAVTVGFIALRFLLTPVRIIVITSVLQPAEYGALTLLSMTAHGLALMVSLGGFEVLLRKLPGVGQAGQHAYFRTVLLVSALVGLGMCLVLVFIWNRAPWLSDLSSLLGPVVVVLFFLCFLLILQRIHYLLGRREHVRARVVQLFWGDLWFLPILAAMPVIAWNAERAAWVWIVWLLATMALTWNWVPYGPVFRDRTDRVPVRDVLCLGLPLLPVLTADWVFRLVGHYALLIHADAATMALYALALNVALIGLVASTPLVDLCSVELSRAAGRGIAREGPQHSAREVFSRGLRHVLAISAPVALVLVFMPRDVIGLLAGPDFQAAAEFLPWASAVPVLLAANLLFARALMLQGESAVVGCGAIVGAVAAVAFCLPLVPTFGAPGALAAITCASMCVNVLYAIRMRLWKWLDGSALGGGGLLLGAFLLGLGFFWVESVPGGSLFRLAVMGVFTAGVLFLTGAVRIRDFQGAGDE